MSKIVKKEVFCVVSDSARVIDCSFGQLIIEKDECDFYLTILNSNGRFSVVMDHEDIKKISEALNEE